MPFRRPGLAEDDNEAEVRPEANHSRRHTLPYQPTTTRHVRIPAHAIFDGEESVVSGLSATSDLDSLYLESSAQKLQYHNPRDQHLLAQRLPGQFGNDNPALKEHGVGAPLSGFIDENDIDDNWEDVVFAATKLPAAERNQRKSYTSPSKSSTRDPVEKDHTAETNEIINEIIKMKKAAPKKGEKKDKRSSTKKKTKNETTSDISSTKKKSKKAKTKVGNYEKGDGERNHDKENGEIKDRKRNGKGDMKDKKNGNVKSKSRVDPPVASKKSKENDTKSSKRWSMKSLMSPKKKTARE